MKPIIMLQGMSYRNCISGLLKKTQFSLMMWIIDVSDGSHYAAALDWVLTLIQEVDQLVFTGYGVPMEISLSSTASCYAYLHYREPLP